MPNPDAWKDVEIVDEQAAAAGPGYVDLAFTLDRVPEPGWGPLVVGSKQGSMDFVMSNPGSSGNRITWRVPDEALERAAGYIRTAVVGANERYRATVVPRLQREAEARRSADEERRRRTEEAQERLRRSQG